MGDKSEFFEVGREALLGTIRAMEQGRPLTRREVALPDPPPDLTAAEIVRLRVETFHVSQQVFASMLNVAAKTVQAWEQGRNKPAGATLRLLHVVRDHPEVLRTRFRARRKGQRPRAGKLLPT